MIDPHGTDGGLATDDNDTNPLFSDDEWCYYLVDFILISIKSRLWEWSCGTQLEFTVLTRPVREGNIIPSRMIKRSTSTLYVQPQFSLREILRYIALQFRVWY
jgi:hypothetical protein